MDIIPLSSGSSGNCYVVKLESGPAIMIEAGLPFSDLQRSLWDNDLKLSEIDRCFISHKHGDHAKATQDLLDRQISISMPYKTVGALGLDHDLVEHLRERRTYHYDTYTVKPYGLEHGAVINYGYLVLDQSGEQLFYATDALKQDFIFRDITHLMIEVNYQDKYLQSSDNFFHQKKSIETHTSLKTAVDYFSKIDKSRLKEIWVIHLSSTYADTSHVKRRVQEETGAEVYIA